MLGMHNPLLVFGPLALAVLALASVFSRASEARPAAPATNLRAADTKLKDSDHKRVGKAMGECIAAYLAREGRREAEAALRKAIEKKWKKAAKGSEPLSLTEDLGASLYHARNYSKARGVKKGKIAGFEVPVEFYGEDFVAEYELWAPSKYKAKQGPYPLIICLPGSTATPKEHLEERWHSSEVRDACILVALHMPPKEEHWGSLGVRGDPENAGGMGMLLSVFGDVGERFAVDVNRIFLVGEGPGGAEAAMRIGNSFPDRFAGVICISGDAADLAPDNFCNLPLFFAGGGSKATEFAGLTEKAGGLAAEVAPDATEADIWSWIGANPRRSNPERVVLLAGAPFPNKAYWIEIPPSDGTQVARLEAVADRDSNTITVTAKGITSLTIYYNDLIVDLDKPVKVILNGLTNEDLIPRNFNTMMDQIYKSRSDPGKIYTAVKSYDVPAAADDGDAQGGSD